MPTIASHSPLNISQTVKNRGLVPKGHQYEMAYGESNNHVTDDITWPRKVKSWPQYTYSLISRKQLEMLFSNNIVCSAVGYPIAIALLLVCPYLPSTDPFGLHLLTSVSVKYTDKTGPLKAATHTGELVGNPGCELVANSFQLSCAFVICY